MGIQQKEERLLKKINSTRDERGVFYKYDLYKILKKLNIGEEEGEKMIQDLYTHKFIKLLGGDKGKDGRGYRTIKMDMKGLTYIAELNISIYRQLINHFNEYKGIYSVLISAVTLLILFLEFIQK